MSKIVLVHGIRTKEPEATLGGLQRKLLDDGMDAVAASYGYILFPLTNGKARKAVKKTAEPGDTLVGYSNGCYAIWQECEDVQPEHVVLISPALSADVEWPDCVKTITVFYSPGDTAVWWGGTWAAVANTMPWRWGSARDHKWGRMGLTGPDTNDPRVKAVCMGDKVAHSWYKYPEKVKMIHERISKTYRG